MSRTVGRRVALAMGLAMVLSPVATVRAATHLRDPGSLGTAIQPASVGTPSWRDFDANGYADLAIGAPYDNVSGAAEAGVVHVFYGSAAGLSASADDLWHQNVTGIANSAESGDHFGWSLASGDYNNDGYGDLAIGVPHENLSLNGANQVDAGLVHVLWGSVGGLLSQGSLTRNLLDIATPGNAQFGLAMVALDARDLDGGGDGADGYADLAVGAPGVLPIGRIRVFEGQQLSPASDGGAIVNVGGGVVSSARIGAVLAAGNVQGSPEDDIIVGLPMQDVGGTDAGGVQVYSINAGQFGSSYAQGANGPADVPEAGDRFGAALAAGDLDGDGVDEMIIGVPGEDFPTRTDAGMIHIRWSDPDGTAGPGFAEWKQYTQGTITDASDSTGNGDLFGSSFAIGRFDPSLPSLSLLAIGAPGDRLGPNAAAASGAVTVAHGNRTEVNGMSFRQGVGLVSNAAEGGDRFGLTLGAANFGMGATDDLVVGVPLEDRGGSKNSGIVHVLYGTGDWMDLGDDEQVWHQDVSGVPEVSQPKDRFGLSVE